MIFFNQREEQRFAQEIFDLTLNAAQEYSAKRGEHGGVSFDKHLSDYINKNSRLTCTAVTFDYAAPITSYTPPTNKGSLVGMSVGSTPTNHATLTIIHQPQCNKDKLEEIKIKFSEGDTQAILSALREEPAEKPASVSTYTSGPG